MGGMTKEQIDAIFERVRSWPLERQEDAAEVLLTLEQQGTDVYELSDDEIAEIELALEEAERGEFATDEEMKALFDRYRGA
jgi:predicted transcriptional regulator